MMLGVTLKEEILAATGWWVVPGQICGTLSHCQATFIPSEVALVGRSPELQIAPCSLSYIHDSQGPTQHSLSCCVTYMLDVCSGGLLQGGPICSPSRYTGEPSAASCITFSLKSRGWVPS